MDPLPSDDLALDSCLLAQGKNEKLTTDPESLPLCGPSDTEDPANDADLTVHDAYTTDNFSQSMNNNTRPIPIQGRCDSTDDDNDIDLVSVLPLLLSDDMDDIPNSTREVSESYQEASNKNNDDCDKLVHEQCFKIHDFCNRKLVLFGANT